MNEQASNLETLFGEPISIYTRAQAIEDGELVDVSAHAAEVGFGFPTALTRSLWADIAGIPARYDYEDAEGRTHDVLWMASLAARSAAGSGSRVGFEVILHTSPEAPNRRIHRKRYLMDIGPGDTPSPVITIGNSSDF